MATPKHSKTVLLLIDIQDGLKHPTYWGPSRSNPSFERNTEAILEAYRTLVSSAAHSQGTSPHKIIHIAHASQNAASPLAPSSPGFQFQSCASPLAAELVVTKNVNSGFIGTDLEAVLRRHFDGAPGTLYLIGLTADHCVSTTARMAGNLGVCDAPDGEKGDVVLVDDATAAWQKSEDSFEAELVHKVHVESLQEFATIEKTEDVLQLWKGWLGGRM